MRRWLITLLTIAISLSIVTVNPLETKAISSATLSCSANQYSVDRITGKDIYTNLACYSETQFGEAYAFMLAKAAESPNVVIRHADALSPLRIVAADRAMAYSQNYTRLNLSTMDITKDKALTVPFSYMNQSNPMYYFKTEVQTKSITDTIKPSDLSVEIEVNGAHGYVPLNGVDLIPLIYVENRVNKWYIDFTTKSIEGVYTGNLIKPNIPYYVVSDATNLTKFGNVSLRQIRLYTDFALTYAYYDIGLAPDWLPNGTYYSANGINFYYDMDLKNPVLNNGSIGFYYNYYQYLNLRTKTNYSGTDLDEYFNYFASVNPNYLNKPITTSVMKDQGTSFVNAQNTYGMNALLIYSMAAHESAFGTSTYAVNYYNLFGYGAYDSNPNNAINYSYPSVAEGVNQHMGWNLRKYLDYSNYSSNNSLFYASNIGNKGAGVNTRYASDPWWSVKIAQWAFKIDRYLGLKDFNTYQMAVLGSSTNRTVYMDSAVSSQAYTVDNRATNYPFVLLTQVNDFVYKTQSTNPISNGSIITGTTPGVIPYDWNASVVYVNTTQVTLANTPSQPIQNLAETDNLVVYNSKLEWTTDNKILLKGYSAFRNTNMATVSVSHIFRAISLEDQTNSIDFPLTISTSPDFAINLLNGYDYSKAWFEGTLDLSTLPVGHYRFEIVTTAGDRTASISFVNSDISAPKPEPKFVAGNNYRFIFNNGSRMRYELYVEKGLDFSSTSYQYPTRFYPVSFFNSFSITNGILGMDGLAYIIGNPTGVSNSVSHQFLMLSDQGIQTLTNLTTSTGLYNYSNGGYDYSNAWFSGTVDLTTLPTGTYTLYILTSSNNLTDAIEIRNYLNVADYVVSYNSKTYTIKGNSVLKKRIELTITNN